MSGAGELSLFRPSNGTIGEAFHADFCARCIHDVPFGKCDILSRTLIHKVTDLEYPTEWVSDANGSRCTAFQSASDPRIRDHRQAEMTL
jgi:hypothetical protein